MKNAFRHFGPTTRSNAIHQTPGSNLVIISTSPLHTIRITLPFAQTTKNRNKPRDRFLFGKGRVHKSEPKMGLSYNVYLNSDKIFGCKNCKTHLASHDAIISRVCLLSVLLCYSFQPSSSLSTFNQHHPASSLSLKYRIWSS